MKMSRALRITLLFIGLAIYVASFFPFVDAVKDNAASPDAAGFPGWKCALLALQAPWGHSAGEMFHENPVGYFAVLFSGWINPLFLIALVASLIRPKGRFATAFRVITILMFPACWFAFHALHVRPVAGYFLWTGAMLVVVLSFSLATVTGELKAAGGE